jgi:hypothetical protein
MDYQDWILRKGMDFLLAKNIPALMFNQLPVNGHEGSFQRAKQLEHEADHLSTSTYIGIPCNSELHLALFRYSALA